MRSAERSKLEENAEIPHFRAGPGRSIRTGKPAQRNPNWITGEQKKQAADLFFNKGIAAPDVAKRLGVTTRQVERAVHEERIKRQGAASITMDKVLAVVAKLTPAERMQLIEKLAIGCEARVCCTTGLRCLTLPT